MSVKWIWSGATTSTSVMVTARLTVTATTVRLIVSTNPDLSSPTDSDSVSPDSDLYVQLVLSSLTPRTKYYYGIEIDGTIDSDIQGSFWTLPVEDSPASFTIGFASCAQETPGRNYTTYKRIIDRDPLLFLFTGDYHYVVPNGGDETAWDASTWQTLIDTAMSQSHRSAWHRAMAVPSIWDDHDYNPNQVESQSFSKKDVSAGVFRQARPHYTFAAPDGDNAVYYSFKIGRILFIVMDLRYHRDENTVPDGVDMTLLGATQKAWVKAQFDQAKTDGCPQIFLVSSSVWTNQQDQDTWGSATYERAELVQYMQDNAIPPVTVLSGDMHGLAFAEGMDVGFSTTRRVPEHVSASIAAAPGVGRPNANFTFPPVMSMGQYSTLTITDDGTDCHVTIRGWQTVLSTSDSDGEPDETMIYETVDNVLTYPASAAVWTNRPLKLPVDSGYKIFVVKTNDGQSWVQRAMGATS